MRKTTIILAFIALALASCSKNGEQQMVDSPLAISFNGFEVTKASGITDSGSEIQVYGARCDGDTFSAANAETVFDGQSVTYNGSVWSYNPIKYWIPSSIYKFRGVFPYHKAEITDNLEDPITIAGFTVQEAQASQEDLMVSDICTRTTTSPIASQEKVSLTFRHLLCYVNLRIKNTTSDTFTLTKVSLTGMKNKGTYSNGAWNVTEGSNLSCSKKYTGTAGVVSETGILVWGDGGLLLIPETLGAVKVILEYTVTHEGSTNAKTKTLTLPIPTSPQWQSGYKYVYSASLSESYDIKFSEPTVEEWSAEQAAGTIVIK